jgi:hypothetical protein
MKTLIANNDLGYDSRYEGTGVKVLSQPFIFRI